MREIGPMAAIKNLVYILCILSICLTAPSMAGSKYMAGSPELSAYISGTNEFSPGTDVQLIVVIENNGLN